MPTECRSCASPPGDVLAQSQQVWFAQVEAIFNLQPITSEASRFVGACYGRLIILALSCALLGYRKLL